MDPWLCGRVVGGICLTRHTFSMKEHKLEPCLKRFFLAIKISSGQGNRESFRKPSLRPALQHCSFKELNQQCC